MAKETIHFPESVCIKETDKALLVEYSGWDGQHWIPKSQVDDDSEVYKEGDEGDLVLSAWFAEKEGLV